jgi:hypothetical protein
LINACFIFVAPRGFEPLQEKTEPIDNKELTGNTPIVLVQNSASLCTEQPKNESVNPAESLVFDHEKEAAIQGIIKTLRQWPKSRIIFLADKLNDIK